MAEKIITDPTLIKSKVSVVSLLESFGFTFTDYGDKFLINEGLRRDDEVSSCYAFPRTNSVKDFSGNSRLDPSFDDDKNLSVIDVTMYLTGLNFADATIYLSHFGDVPLKKGTKSDIEKHLKKLDIKEISLKDIAAGTYGVERDATQELKTEYLSKVIDFIPQEIIDYAASRKIPKEILERNDVKCMFGSTPTPLMAFCSYDDKGEIANVSIKVIEKPTDQYLEYLKSKNQKPLKSYQLSGGKAYLYGLKNVIKDIPLIITEGQFDKFSLEVAGFENVLSVTNGSQGLSFLGTDWFSKFLKEKEISEVMVLGDNDVAGYRYRINMQKKLEEMGIKVTQISIPRELKDANDYLQATSPEQLRETIKHSKSRPYREEINREELLEDYYNKLIKYIQKSKKKEDVSMLKVHIKEISEKLNEDLYNRVTTKEIVNLYDSRTVFETDPTKDISLFQGEELQKAKKRYPNLNDSEIQNAIITKIIYGDAPKEKIYEREI